MMNSNKNYLTITSQLPCPKALIAVMLMIFINLCNITAQLSKFPMEQFIGVNLRREDPIQYLKAVGFIREYRDWAIDEGNSIKDNLPQPLPNNKYKWNKGFGTSTRFDNFYATMNQAVGFGNVCATMKSCLPYLAGGDNFGIFSEFKPIPHSWTGTTNNSGASPNSGNFSFSPQAGESTVNPNSYRWISDWLYQFTLKYGAGTNMTSPLKRFAGEPMDRNTGKIRYIELWNEPDKYWIKTYDNSIPLSNDGWLNATKFTGAEYAAMASAVYDANNQTISVGDGIGGTYKPGVKLADPLMKLVLGGTAGIREYDWKFIKDMKNWFTINRPGVMPFNVINFHHYNSNKWVGLPGNIAINGEEAASPEEDRWDIGTEANVSIYGEKSSNEDAILSFTNKDAISKIDPINTNRRTFKQRLIELKNRVNAEFGNNVEIWMSEFGFDTNEKSPYRVPKLKDDQGNIVLDDKQEVQGRFLVRAYLEIAAAGWDRAMQFCIRDEDSGSEGSLFQASGLVKDKANNYAPKKSYYYVSTMKDALKGTQFKGETIFGGDPTLVGGIYSSRSFNFTNPNLPRLYTFHKVGKLSPSGAIAGDIVYVVWLPTKQNLTKPNVTVPVPSETTQATLVTTQVGDINGVNQPLTIYGSSTNKWVVIPLVTENPVYIRLGESKNDAVTSPPSIISATGVSCDAINLNINVASNTTYAIYYYEKNDKEENGIVPAFNISDPNLKLFAENLTSSNILVGGLYLGHDKYHIFVTATNALNGNVSLPTRVEATTTSCSNNVINAVVQSISNSDTYLKQALNRNDFSLCYPIRDPNALGEWVDFSPNAPTEGYIQFVDNQGNEQSCLIDLVSLLDGNGEGNFQMEYSNMSNTYTQGWIQYETIGLNTWVHFSKSVIASRIKIKRLDNDARIRKIIFRGRPVSSSTYSIACCGANESALKIISGNTTTSVQISVGNLVSDYWNKRQVLRIDGNLDIDNNYAFTNNSLLYMSPGSKITVKGRKYLGIQNSAIQGCDNKWQGILIEPEGQLDSYNSSIRDATVGIDMQNAPDCSWGTYCSIYNSVLEENVTAVRKAYGQISGCDYLYVYGCIFDGNKRNLKPDYSGISFSYNPNESLDGIILQSNYQGWLGLGWGLPPNIFQNLANGITSNNSTTYIQNSIFRNINTTKVIDPYWGFTRDYGGYGIQTSSGKLTLRGLGNAQNTPFTFDKVAVPIYMYSTNFDIQDCKISTTLNNSFSDWYSGTTTYGGIYAQYDGLGSNIIKNNTITANGSGITTIMQSNPTSIENNTIDCNQINADLSVTAGSNVSTSSMSYWDNAPAAYNIYSIKNNTLIMNRLKRSNGINLLGTGGGLIENNTIISRDYQEAAKSSDSTFLINIISSPKNFINKNTLKGVGGNNAYTPYNVGINMISSPNNSITCNSIKDNRIGITLDGNNQTGDSQSDPNIKGIAGNVLEGYNRGLLLRSPTAIVGQHSHKMNRWVGASNDNKAAEFKNTLVDQFVNNRFWVGYNNSEINPTSITGAVSVDVGSNTNWLVSQAVSNPYTCPSTVGAGLINGGLQVRGDAENEFYATGEHPYINRKIVENADNIKKSLNIADASSWLMERDAYNYYKDKLKGVPASNASLKAFFKKHDNSDIGLLAQLDAEWINLNEVEYKNERKQAKELDSRLSILSQNTVIDIRKLQNLKDPQQKRDYIKSVSNDSISILHGKLIQLQKGYSDRIAKKARQLLTINDRLSDNLLYVKYEKEINSIYLNLLANNKTQLSQAEVERVRTIAMMCPEEAGKAPYKARSLYLFATTVPLPDWSNKCKTPLLPRQEAAERDIVLSLYPNPAKEDITISLSTPLSINAYNWQITDMTGKALKLGKLNGNTETINTQSLNSGIYMIQVLKDNTIIKVEKFTIIK